MDSILAKNDLEALFNLSGSQVTKSPISELIEYKDQKNIFYIKKYHQAGKYLRKYVGRSRLKAEYENLNTFRKLGIPIPNVVNFQEKRNLTKYEKGILITEKLENVYSLADLTVSNKKMFDNKKWFDSIIIQLAAYTKTLHDNNFIHNDLKWRNILVTLDTNDPKVYFIDCPCGSIKFGPFLSRGKIKDLACLDKVAKYVLDNKIRLKFYKQYLGVDKLTKKDKKNIIKILKFFENRE